MKTTFLAIATFFIFLWAQVSMASTISCHTPTMNKDFTITNDSVVFNEEVQTRSIASVEKVLTKKVGLGFTKTLSYEGNRYIIHVENEKSFSEVEDYLSIRSEKGHEITYPLNCEIKA